MKKLIFIAALCLASFARAQDKFPELKYDANTLGSKLQPFFVSHCAGCRLFPPKDLEKYQLKRDFVVWELQLAWKTSELLKKKVTYSNSDIVSIFSHIRFKNDTAILNPYPQNSYFSEYLSQKYSAPKVGNYTMYSKNCQGYYQSNTKGGVRFPGGSADASINADQEFTSIILLNEGTFINPISQLLKANDPGILFKIWDFYKGNPSYVNDNAYYIDQIRGVMISNQLSTAANRDFAAKVAASGGINTPLVSANIQTSNELTLSVKSMFESQHFGVMFFDNQLRSAYKALPSVSEVKALVGTIAKPEFRPVDNFYSKAKADFTHKIIIKGLSTDMALNYWDIVQLGKDNSETVDDNTKFYSTTPTITSVKEANGSIEMTITGDINAKNFEGTEKSQVDLNYKLRSKVKVGDTYLEIGPIRKPIQTSNHPNIRIAETTHGTENRGNNNSVQTWSVDLNVLDDPKVIDRDNGMKITNVKMYKGTDAVELDYPTDKLFFANAKDNRIKFDLKTKNILASGVDKFEDTYNLEVTAEFSSKTGTIQKTSPVKSVSFSRPRGANKPNATYSYKGAAPDNTWNFILDVVKGDVDLDSNSEPLLLDMNLVDVVTGLPLADPLKNFTTSRIPASNKYSFSLKPTTNPVAQTILRDVRLSGTIYLRNADGSYEVVKHENLISIDVPYAPVTAILNSAATSKSGKLKWNADLKLTDSFNLIDAAAKVTPISATASYKGKIVPLVLKLEKVDNSNYKIELESQEGALKTSEIKDDYSLEVVLKIELKGNLTTKSTCTLLTQGFAIAQD